MRGRIKTLNRAAEEITGLKFNEIENNLLENIIPELVPLLEKRENAGIGPKPHGVQMKVERGEYPSVVRYLR